MVIMIKIDDLKNLLKECIDELYDRDLHLIENNLYERTIAHRLATYLQNRIETKDSKIRVDCEYNGDVDDNKNELRRKRIIALSEKLREIGKDVKGEEEFQSLRVYPDIIIHERGKNEENALIIEIKKEFDERQVGDAFDRLKLERYTSNCDGNHLNY